MICNGTVAINQKRERERADMSAHSGAACDTYDKRHFKRISQVIQEFKSQHYVCLLITYGIVGNIIIVPQILFCLL